MSLPSHPLDDPSPVPLLRPAYTDVVELGLVVYHVVVCVFAIHGFIHWFVPVYFMGSLLVAALMGLVLIAGLFWLHVDWIRLYWRWVPFSKAYDKGILAVETVLDIPFFLLVRSLLMMGWHAWCLYQNWLPAGINDAIFRAVLGGFLSSYEGYYWHQKQRVLKAISLSIRYI